MFKILVCLDGSPRAEGALPYAMACARTAGPEAEILLSQVPEPPALVPAEVYPQLLGTLTEQVEAYLEGLTTRLRELGYGAGWRVPREGFYDGLLDLALSEQVALLVLTSHGRTGASRLLLGSVAEKLARQSPVPALLIPRAAISSAPWDKAELPLLSRVVLPTDGSELSETALRFAEMVPIQPGQVHLVMGTDGSDRTGERIDDLLGRYERYLQCLAARLDFAACEVSIRACDRTPAEAIHFVARDVRADLIAMATHGRSGLTRLMLGSVAEQVARSATCAVLLINPRCLETKRRNPPWQKQAPEAPSIASGTASTSTGSRS